MSIREKLDLVLLDRGWDVSGVEDVWLATMPSFVGFEGINPLSVYYLYRKVSEDEGPRLWIVVLEVRGFMLDYFITTCSQFVIGSQHF